MEESRGSRRKREKRGEEGSRIKQGTSVRTVDITSISSLGCEGQGSLAPRIGNFEVVFGKKLFAGKGGKNSSREAPHDLSGTLKRITHSVGGVGTQIQGGGG